MSNIGNVTVSYPENIVCDIQYENDYGWIWISGGNHTWKSKIERPFIASIENEKFFAELPGMYNFFNKFNKKHTKFLSSQWSMINVNIQKIVKSCIIGFKKYIKVNGVGYKLLLDEIDKKKLIATIGFTHSLMQKLHPSFDLTFTRKSRMARVWSPSLSKMTNMCWTLRNRRKPNVFTGKGIRFRYEKVWRKIGKKKKI